MKKFFVSVAILVVFFVYSIGIRHQRPRIAKPSNLSRQTTSSFSANPSSLTYSSSQKTNSSNESNTTNPTTTGYKNGTYTGSVADAYYGQVQVQAVINNNKITNLKFLSYPNSHPASVYINQQAIPYLKQETIQSQNANVQIISGATFTSEAFIQSLTNALSKAHA
ncbi:MAG: FMN-binding protein [Patescibacteria group bacterium]|nr:FMN-binding protein [Patescibacteria group bacterium]